MLGDGSEAGPCWWAQEEPTGTEQQEGGNSDPGCGPEGGAGLLQLPHLLCWDQISEFMIAEKCPLTI